MCHPTVPRPGDALLAGDGPDPEAHAQAQAEAARRLSAAAIDISLTALALTAASGSGPPHGGGRRSTTRQTGVSFEFHPLTVFEEMMAELGDDEAGPEPVAANSHGTEEGEPRATAEADAAAGGGGGEKRPSALRRADDRGFESFAEAAGVAFSHAAPGSPPRGTKGAENIIEDTENVMKDAKTLVEHTENVMKDAKTVVKHTENVVILEGAEEESRNNSDNEKEAPAKPRRHPAGSVIWRREREIIEREISRGNDYMLRSAALRQREHARGKSGGDAATGGGGGMTTDPKRTAAGRASGERCPGPPPGVGGKGNEKTTFASSSAAVAVVVPDVNLEAFWSGSIA